MEQHTSKALVKGAFILTIAGLVGKVLGAGYRIPLQNLTGDIGFYIYQQVYPILGFALMLSLYGFPSAIAKLTTDLKAEGQGLSVRSFYIPVVFIIAVFCGLIGLVIYLMSPSLAEWIGDPHLHKVYAYSAFVFLLIPFTASLRGVFQGELDMSPVAYSQVLEQFIRVVIIILVAVYFRSKVEALYLIGEFASFASVCAAISAFIVLIIYFIKRRPYVRTHYQILWRKYIYMVVVLGTIATLNHALLLIVQATDALTLLPQLIKHGLPIHEAIAQKGVFDRGQPLIQLGSVLGSSFALAIMPAISKKKLEFERNIYEPYIQTALKCSLVLSIAATAGLIILFPEANILLFEDDLGTSSLQILMLTILFSSLAMTGAAILQGLGFIRRTAVYIALSLVVKWLLNLVLVPSFGTVGSALATVLSIGILAFVILLEVRAKMPSKKLFGYETIWGALSIALLSMIAYVFIVNQLVGHLFTGSRVYLLFYILFVSGTGAFVFLFILTRRNAFTDEEIQMLPFRSLIERIRKL